MKHFNSCLRIILTLAVIFNISAFGQEVSNVTKIRCNAFDYQLNQIDGSMEIEIFKTNEVLSGQIPAESGGETGVSSVFRSSVRFKKFPVIGTRTIQFKNQTRGAQGTFARSNAQLTEFSRDGSNNLQLSFGRNDFLHMTPPKKVKGKGGGITFGDKLSEVVIETNMENMNNPIPESEKGWSVSNFVKASLKNIYKRHDELRDRGIVGTVKISIHKGWEDRDEDEPQVHPVLIRCEKLPDLKVVNARPAAVNDSDRSIIPDKSEASKSSGKTNGASSQ